MEAALKGSGEISFTILSMALSLVADALGSNRAGDQLALGFYQDFK